MRVSLNISLFNCFYWYDNLNSCKYLKREAHLRNAQVNKASSVNKGIFKICLVVDMVRKNWSWIVVASCGFHYFVSAHFTVQNTVISPKFLVRKFCGTAQFPQSFWQIVWNYVESVPIHKISTPGNSVKLWYFTQCLGSFWVFGNFSAAERFKHLFFTAMKIHIMELIVKKQTNFTFSSLVT